MTHDRSKGEQQPVCYSSAPGERAVSVGGDANGPITTGDNNIISNNSVHLVKPDPEALEVVIGRVFKARLHQIPPDLGDFAGRKNEIAAMLALLSGGTSTAAISAISGMGGVGKTALAIHVAHRLSECYPDGQIFIQLAGTSNRMLSPGEAMARVIRSFEPAVQIPVVESEIAAIYRSVLTGKRAVLLLDDARDAAQIRQLVPPKGCAMIVTARRVLALSGVQPIELRELSEPEACGLIESILLPERVSKSEMEKIARACGCLPLALRVAATFLNIYRNWTAESYLQALSDERQRLQRLRVDDDATLDVVASLRISETQLALEHPELAERWQLLSVFPASFDEFAASAVWKAELVETRDQIGKLVARSMVIYDGTDKRYSLHDLMRDVARGTYMRDEQTSAPLRKLLHQGARHHAAFYFGRLVWAGSLYMQGHDKAVSGLTLFDLERRNIDAAQAWAAENSASDIQAACLCLEFTWHAAYILKLRQSPAEMISWLEPALDASRRLGYYEREVGALNNMALAYATGGSIGRAMELWSEAEKVARKHGYEHGSSMISANVAYFGKLDPDESIKVLQRAVCSARENDDPRTEAAALGNLAIVYRNRNDLLRAIEVCNQSLQVASESGDPAVTATTLGVLANAYSDTKDFDKSIETHKRRLDIARKIGDHVNEVDALYRIGENHMASEEYAQAVVFLRTAEKAASEYNLRDYEARVLRALGACYGRQGKTSNAIECFSRELSIHEERNSSSEATVARLNLATAYRNSGELQNALNALKPLKSSLCERSEHQQDREVSIMRAEIYLELGIQYFGRRNLKEAEIHFCVSANIAGEIGDNYRRGIATCNLAQALGMQNEHDRAVSQLEIGVSLLSSVGAAEAHEAQRLLEGVKRR